MYWVPRCPNCGWLWLRSGRWLGSKALCVLLNQDKVVRTVHIDYYFFFSVQFCFIPVCCRLCEDVASITVHPRIGTNLWRPTSCRGLILPARHYHHKNNNSNTWFLLPRVWRSVLVFTRVSLVHLCVCVCYLAASWITLNPCPFYFEFVCVCVKFRLPQLKYNGVWSFTKINKYPVNNFKMLP